MLNKFYPPVWLINDSNLIGHFWLIWRWTIIEIRIIWGQNRAVFQKRYYRLKTSTGQRYSHLLHAE